MMKYIYIDDEDESIAIRDGLNDVKTIHVALEKPKKFEEQSQDLLNKLKAYDGIILDLRLDDHPQSEARYTAPPLAQALRSLAAINQGIGDCPIVLCSTDAKIKKSYIADQSSHDLFDYKFSKDHEPDFPKIVLKLDSLAKGYRELYQLKGDLSSIIRREFQKLDSRIFERLYNPEVNFPSHEYARFLIKELLGQPGPLINEKLLAARLGIDYLASPGWRSLIENFFDDGVYKGVFSDGWRRWWADTVNDKFKSITGKRLSGLKGPERVNVLINVTRIAELTPAKLIPRCVSYNFSTICEFYKQPLDPLEGFRIMTLKEPKPWQEPRYLSIDAAVERKGFTNGLMIHPSESERLERIKTQLKAEGK